LLEKYAFEVTTQKVPKVAVCWYVTFMLI